MENKHKKNILMVIPELNLGGAQRSFSNLSVELGKEYSVHNVVFNEAGESIYELGGPLYGLNVFPGATLLSKVWSFFKRIKRLRELKKKLSINASISFLEGADYINILSRKNDKVIVSIRGSKFHDKEISGWLGFVRLRILMPWLYRRADTIVCVSKGIREELRARMNVPFTKMETIYNFYDLDKHDQALQCLSPSPFDALADFTYLVCVGRFHPQKNFLGAIEIFYRLKMLMPEVKLVIVGDGREKDLLVSRACSHGLGVCDYPNDIFTTDADVIFSGVQVPSLLLKNARGFLLTSLWEGFPNVLLEAMACSVTIFASDCETGPREILAPSLRESGPIVEKMQTPYGMLMPLPDDTESWDHWAETMHSVFGNLQLETSMRRNARKRLQDFSRGAIVLEWKKIVDL